ncbi:MAG: hypothetical protein HRU09_16680, partial [Oligoflexales bacterium]|nr:hypothetical protein [Oligoflexales bacterium]
FNKLRLEFTVFISIFHDLKCRTQVIRDLLKRLERDADVFLVSNADRAWIKLSSFNLLPQTYQLLLELEQKMQFYSAKDFYFQNNPEQGKLNNLLSTVRFWKEFTFKSLFHSYDEVISIGDSDAERLALQSISQGREHLTGKSIKVSVADRLSHVSSQLLHICINWQGILNLEGDLDLHLGYGGDGELGFFEHVELP